MSAELTGKTEVVIKARMVIDNDAWEREYGMCFLPGHSTQADILSYFAGVDSSTFGHGGTLAERFGLTVTAEPASVAEEIRQLARG